MSRELAFLGFRPKGTSVPLTLLGISGMLYLETMKFLQKSDQSSMSLINYIQLPAFTRFPTDFYRRWIHIS